MRPQTDEIRHKLGQLVQGMTNLRHDGQFDEPNLDGTAGDYISFDSWEWPQGVGLYGLAQLWRRHRDPALQALLELINEEGIDPPLDMEAIKASFNALDK